MGQLEKFIMTKEQIASMLIESIRESLDSIIAINENTNSTEVVALYSDLYIDKLGQYKEDTLKSLISTFIEAGESQFEISVSELKDFLNTAKTEAEACKFLLERIQFYILGDKDELEKLLSSPLTDKEKNKIFIIQSLLINFYSTLSNPRYHQKSKEIIVENFEQFLTKQKEEIDILKNKMDGIQAKLQNSPIKESDKVGQTMKQILEFCGKSESDINSYMENRKEFEKTNSKEDAIKVLNTFSNIIWGKNLITEEIWDKVENGLKDGTLKFDQESIDKLIEEIDLNMKN